MTSMKKFMFDTSFEPPVPPGPAPRDSLPAGPPPGDGPEEAVADEPEIELPPLPSYSEEELEAARQEASKSGWEAGKKAAMDEAERALTDSLAGISSQLAELQQSTMASTELHLCDTANLATVLVRRLFPKLNEHYGLAEIDSLIGDCLEHLRDEPRLVLRVSNGLLEPVRKKMENLLPRTGFEGKLVYLGDDTMGTSDVRLEWADGGAERNCARQWEEIDALIARAMRGNAVAPDESVGSPGATAPSPAEASAESQEIEEIEAPIGASPDAEDPGATAIGAAPDGPAIEKAPLAGGLS